MNFLRFFAFFFQTMVRFTSLVIADDANRIMFCKKSVSKTIELNVFLVTSDLIKTVRHHSDNRKKFQNNSCQLKLQEND